MERDEQKRMAEALVLRGEGARIAGATRSDPGARTRAAARAARQRLRAGGGHRVPHAPRARRVSAALEDERPARLSAQALETLLAVGRLPPARDPRRDRAGARRRLRPLCIESAHLDPHGLGTSPGRPMLYGTARAWRASRICPRSRGSRRAGARGPRRGQPLPERRPERSLSAARPRGRRRRGAGGRGERRARVSTEARRDANSRTTSPPRASARGAAPSGCCAKGAWVNSTMRARLGDWRTPRANAHGVNGKRLASRSPRSGWCTSGAGS